jgi:hypothetical protein
MTAAPGRRRWALLAAAASVLAALGALFVAFPPPSAAPALPAPPPIEGMAVGSPAAPVKLIMLFDLRCPYCAEAEAQLGPLLERLAAEGRVEVILVGVPAHPGSLQLHQMLYCAYGKLGNSTLKLVDELYAAYPNYTEQIRLLAPYNCTATAGQIYAELQPVAQWLQSHGIPLATPTFIVVKGGKAYVVVGAEPQAVESLLTR